MKDPRRTALLVIALLLVAAGGTAIMLGNTRPTWTILMRAGIALGVIWLAMPEMSKWSYTRSWPFIVGLLVAGIILVTRPKLVLFAIAAMVAGMLVNFVLKRLARSLTNKHRQEQ